MTEETTDETVVVDDKIAEANNAAKRMEDAVAAMKVQNDRSERLRVQETLSGKADVNVQKKEESPSEYAERVMRNEI